MVTGVHVLGHILQVPAEAAADLRSSRRLEGGFARKALVAGTLATGLALAVVLLPLEHNWSGGFG